MRIQVVCAVVLVLLFCRSNAENTRPIIGVLAQENHDWPGKGDTFIRSSYFHFIQQAGARGVPIKVNQSDAYYEQMFNSINGLLFPGGSVSVLTSGYANAARKMFDMAIQAHDKGDYFPIWGTCLGFEQLAVLAAGKNVLSEVDGWNMNLPLNFTQDYKDSVLYGYLSDPVYQYVSKTGGTQNMHHMGLLRKTFDGNKELNSFFKVLSTNTDKNGLQYISTMEGKKYPFYGVQFHPEKNIYEWDPKVNVDHSSLAVGFAQYLSDVFVSLARASKHHFPSIEEESKALINNYQTTYMGEPSFHDIYFFNYNDSTTTQSENTDRLVELHSYNVHVFSPEVRVISPNYEYSLTLMLLLLVATLILVVLLRITRLATLRHRLQKYQKLPQEENQADPLPAKNQI